jgi:hypothetical protein
VAYERERAAVANVRHAMSSLSDTMDELHAAYSEYNSYPAGWFAEFMGAGQVPFTAQELLSAVGIASALVTWIDTYNRRGQVNVVKST